MPVFPSATRCLPQHGKGFRDEPFTIESFGDFRVPIAILLLVVVLDFLTGHERRPPLLNGLEVWRDALSE